MSLILSLSIKGLYGYALDQCDTSSSANRRSALDRDSRDFVKCATRSTSASECESIEVDFSDDESFYFEPLQIPCEINGFIIPAIVDTGAQVTVMSESCAKRCHISNLIDGRFSGKAVGIGSSDILGRINELSMRVGPISYHNKVSILRQSRVDLIIGLDFLRRFGAEINLEKRMLKLRVRGKVVRIPFIADHKDYLNSLLSHDTSETHTHNVNQPDDNFNNDFNDNFDDLEEEEDEGVRNEESSPNYGRINNLVDEIYQDLYLDGGMYKESDYPDNDNNNDLYDTDSHFPSTTAKFTTPVLGKIKKDQTKKDLVILNSKLKSHQKYTDDGDEDEDDSDDNDNTPQTFLSMEGV